MRKIGVQHRRTAQRGRGPGSRYAGGVLPGGGAEALLDSELLLEDLEQQFTDDRRRVLPLSPIALLLAVVSLGAATLHFGFASARFEQYWAYGAFFAGVAWLQLAWAFAVLARPSRRVLATGAVLNGAVVAVWVLSRTVGVLVGPQASTTEAVHFPDALATGFEVLAVAGVVACLVAPRLLRLRARRAGLVVLVAVVAVATAAGTAFALTPRFALTTHHAVAVAAKRAKSNASTAGASTLGTGVGQAHNPTELAEQAPDIPLTPDQQTVLAAQLVAARAAALRYPTVADAQRAGLRPAGGFAPGSGAHFISYNYSLRDINPDGSVNAANPGAYIYDGTTPTSRVIGVMYTSLGSGAAPAGFAGLNDHWHQHANVCIQNRADGIHVPFPADRDVTPAMCSAVQGTFMRETVWMVHAWVVPGWESPLGVFSHDNPDVKCADGTTHTDPSGFCQGT